MESGDIEMCQMQVRKVVQDVLLLLWCDNEIITEKVTPDLSFVPEVTTDFLDDLVHLVVLESACDVHIWEQFLRKHLKRMTVTPYRFANYFAYAGNLLTKDITDVYGCFVDVLSLVNHFAFDYWQNEGEDKKFLKCCVELFCEYFNKNLYADFEKQGSWKNFRKYIKNHEKLKKFKELLRKTSRTEAVNEFTYCYLEHEGPHAINGVILKDINDDQVENDDKAISLADSVQDLLKNVCEKTFEEVIKDFQKTDNEVENLYRKKTGTASGGETGAEDQLSPEIPEKTLENAPSNTNPEKSKDPRKKVKPSDTLNTPVSDSTEPQDQSSQKQSPVTPESYLIPKENVEKAKSLLGEMKKDIEKMSELIRFLCKEKSIEVPKQFSTRTK